MGRSLSLCFLAALVFALSACAHERILDGRTLQPVTLEDAAASVKQGSVVVMGDLHGSKLHNEHQVKLLQALATHLPKISVGLEFLEVTHQAEVDQYLAGQLSEEDFLKAVKWGKGYPFENYREQALFPKTHDGATLALNAPRALTGRISKVGLEGLTTEEKAQLPKNFQLGNDLYFERFSKVMDEHVPKDKVKRYFESQSVWDDTMAATAQDFLSKHSDQTLVIIVGDFHVAYGGGTPDRLKARGANPVVSISQVDLREASDDEKRSELDPGTKNGPRADFIWVTE
jgi:uncharacterized iron-regulated protein